MRLMNELLTPELKAKIADLFEQSNQLTEEQSEFIEQLHCKLTLAERVCYTAKGYLAHKDDPLGGVYLDHLKNTLQLWEKR